MKKLRIILAKDHAPVRAGIRALSESIPNVEVAGNGATFFFDLGATEK